MANKSLFQSIVGKLIPRTDAANEAGGRAYQLSPKGALAQYAATGCLNGTYYASAGEQLERALALAAGADAEFVAKTAIYARERAFMKDMPALLLAHLSVREPDLFARSFSRVVADARMLRTFVQILRSGAVGRKSLGSRPKRARTRPGSPAGGGEGLRGFQGGGHDRRAGRSVPHAHGATARAPRVGEHRSERQLADGPDEPEDSPICLAEESGSIPDGTRETRSRAST